MIHMPLCRGLSRARVCVAGPSCLCHNAQNRQRGAPGTVHRYHILIHVCLTLSRVLQWAPKVYPFFPKIEIF